MVSKDIIKSLLNKADIEINGSRDWDIQIHNSKFYSRVLRGGTLGLGESYMEGWWDVKKLDTFFERSLKTEIDEEIRKKIFFAMYLAVYTLIAKIFNKQSIKRAFEVGKKHYDIGNELYVHMLDPNMQYSCGYWKDAETLEEAQIAKMDLICKKLQLKKGVRVLDIGCGWGGLSAYMARHYDADVVGITVSNEQAKLAKERVKDLSVEILVEDYRSLDVGRFDRIVSVGMFEHVGYKNYHDYMKKVHALLKDDGIFLLHTIGSNESVFSTDPWIDKHIFPNGMLPSTAQIGKSYEKYFVMEDWHNFGPDYDRTLMAWHRNFMNAWPVLSKSEKYDETFQRKWEYYLLSCAGLFRARKAQLWQIVLSKNGIDGGYTSVR